MESIDLTPTWTAATRIYIEVLRNEDASFEAVKNAKEELMRLAQFADKMIRQKELRNN